MVGEGGRRLAGPAGLSGPGVWPRTKEKARTTGLVGDVSFGEGVSARGGSRGTGGDGLRGLPGFPGLGVWPRTKEKACGAGLVGGVSFGEGVSARGDSRGTGGDGLRGLPGFSGPLGLGVWTRTKEKARAAGLVGGVSFGEGVSARGDSRGTGRRRLAGPAELPGLPDPGVRLGNGEATACGACPGFPSFPAFPAQGCGWGTGRRRPAGPSRVSRASRPSRPGRGLGTGKRRFAGPSGVSGPPGLGVWPRTKEEARGAGLVGDVSFGEGVSA